MQSLRCLLVLTLLFACGSVGHANSIFNYSGVFSSDSDLVVFAYTAPVTGEVDAYTTSFADPTNGFMPVLSLFDSTGAFWYDEYGNCDPSVNCGDGYSSGTDIPASTDLGPADAYLAWNAIAGQTYYIALSVYGNTPTTFGTFDPFNPYPSFTYPGPSDNFTGPAVGVFDNSPFWYQFAPLVERNGDWAATISGPDNLVSNELPEPSSQTYLFIVGGVCVLAGFRRRRRGLN